MRVARWTCTLAGTLTDLKMRALPRSYEEVSLHLADPVVLAERVSTIYGRLAQQNPETTLWATPGNAYALRTCADEGTLFEVKIRGAQAGVVAAPGSRRRALGNHPSRECAITAQCTLDGATPGRSRRMDHPR